MGDTYPTDSEVLGGDEPTRAPTKNDRSLLAAERGTQKTSRLETDASGNLYVNLAAGEIEVKNDVGNPVPVSGTVAVSNQPTTQPVLAHEFARIKNKQFKDTEEARYDIPLVLTSAFTYVGVNTANTATSSATWTIIRTSFDANSNPTRDQIRFNVAWDSRTVGW